MSMSDLIRDRREGRGLTRRELAALMAAEDIKGAATVSAIEAWEKGRRTPKAAYLQTLCTVLKISDAEVGAAMKEGRPR